MHRAPEAGQDDRKARHRDRSAITIEHNMQPSAAHEARNLAHLRRSCERQFRCTRGSRAARTRRPVKAMSFRQSTYAVTQEGEWCEDMGRARRWAGELKREALTTVGHSAVVGAALRLTIHHSCITLIGLDLRRQLVIPLQH